MSEPVSGANPPVTPSATPQLSSTPILVRVLKVAAILAIALIIVGGVVGYFVDGWIGVTSAAIGSAMAFVFLAITAASILIANRSYASPLFTATFFATVLGSWIVKFVLFIVVALLLRDQPWINKFLLFGFLIIGVVGTLVVDMVVIARTRMPYVSDSSLPGEVRQQWDTAQAARHRPPVLPDVEIDPSTGSIRPDSAERD